MYTFCDVCNRLKRLPEQQYEVFAIDDINFQYCFISAAKWTGKIKYRNDNIFSNY